MSANTRPRQNGFTLVGVLIVVAIIATFVAVVVPQITQHPNKARIQATKISSKSIKLAISTYELDTGDDITR